MGYTSRKSRSKKRQSYKRKRYLRGGVGSVPGTPVAGNSPINTNFITPPNNNQNNNIVSPNDLGINLGNQFDDEAANERIIRNTNTVNPNTGSPTSVAHSYFR